MTEGLPSPESTLVEVRLLAMSVSAYRHSSAHHDELFREFALIHGRDPSESHEVPRRLLALVEELDQRFGGFTSAAQSEIAAALERGDEAIDITYHVPPETREATMRLADLLARADDYCRQGELLTVAPPTDAVAFRDWFLGEFVAQIDGAAPTPWPQYLAQVAPLS